jgi:hypothetical protein
LALSILALTACGGGGVQEGDAREASGEILPSTISDTMIETDSLKSQPPLLREVPADEGEEAGEEAGEGEGEPQTLEEAFGGDADAAEAPAD